MSDVRIEISALELKAVRRLYPWMSRSVLGEATGFDRGLLDAVLLHELGHEHGDGSELTPAEAIAALVDGKRAHDSGATVVGLLAMAESLSEVA